MHIMVLGSDLIVLKTRPMEYRVIQGGQLHDESDKQIDDRKCRIEHAIMMRDIDTLW